MTRKERNERISVHPIRTFLMLAMLGLLLLVATVVQGEDQAQKSEAGAAISETVAGLDFKGCIQLALEQSSRFRESALEIEKRQLDESDSRWSMAPYFYLKTSYKLSESSQDKIGFRDYSISFSTGAYDPFKAYFNLKAQKLITKIAILRHQKIISEGIYDLARRLLELDTYHQMAASQEELIKVARQELTFIEQRQMLGRATSLDVQVARQELALARAEKKKILSLMRDAREALDLLLGLVPKQKIILNLPEARRQVLGPFDPENASFEQVRSRSFDLRIHELEKRAQEWKITAAYTRYLPDLDLGVRTPDLSDTEEERDYFISIGASFPIWEGLSKKRNIDRQKKILKQREIESDLSENRLSIRWRAAKRALRNAETTLELARTAEGLARLRERKSEIHYKAGSESLPALLRRRIERIEARKELLSAKQDRDLLLLRLRHLSGDLFAAYVKVASGEE